MNLPADGPGTNPRANADVLTLLERFADAWNRHISAR